MRAWAGFWLAAALIVIFFDPFNTAPDAHNRIGALVRYVERH